MVGVAERHEGLSSFEFVIWLKVNLKYSFNSCNLQLYYVRKISLVSVKYSVLIFMSNFVLHLPLKFYLLGANETVPEMFIVHPSNLRILYLSTIYFNCSMLLKAVFICQCNITTTWLLCSHDTLIQYCRSIIMWAFQHSMSIDLRPKAKV